MFLYDMVLLHLLSLLLLGSCYVEGSALTTAIGANERLCFYADVDKAGEKIGVSRFLVSYGIISSSQF